MKSATSLRWLTLALLLPLVLLGVLAWLGTRQQVRAAWASAREEAQRAGGIAAESLARELAAAVETVPVFPDPPVPGSRSAADDVLDGNDPEALRKLRGDLDAGISAAGLPRRVLAAFRIHEMTGAAADGAALLEIATRQAPSVLTRLALENAAALAGDLPQRWAAGGRARDVFRRHGAGWISVGDGTWWLAAEEAGLRALSPASLERALRISRNPLPAWADLRFPTAGLRARGESLAVVPVDFPGAGTLEIVAARPELLEAAARQQARWTGTLGLLALAVAISGGAVVLIHRAVARERRLNALKSDFVASVSHELRAPVASIRLMADALGAGKLEPRTVADFHALISREGARLSALIENVLDFARIEQGRKRWEFERAELAPLVRETLDLMAPLAAEKSIRLAAVEPLPELTASIDPGAIRQALVNLMDNAIKFSPPGEAVEISLTATDADWRIAISDHGPGIPLAEHARIFERFHRLGGELRRETQGTGIGLSLVKAVAEAHGGRVEVNSAPGEGERVLYHKSYRSHQSYRMKLLIIEDEHPMRTALVETLAAEGYKVRSASDGVSGLEMACTASYDLILLDVMMPGLDGYAVCKALRQRGRQMPVLMLTAKGQVDDRVAGLDSGADDYLMKPFSLKELLARVRALLRRHERARAVPERFGIGAAVVDFRVGTLTRDGREFPLSEKESGMLRLLATTPGEAVSREKFLDVVWGYHATPSTRTVENFIAALRSKLEADPANPRHLVTVRGIGYRLDA